MLQKQALVVDTMELIKICEYDVLFEQASLSSVFMLRYQSYVSVAEMQKWLV